VARSTVSAGAAKVRSRGGCAACARARWPGTVCVALDDFADRQMVDDDAGGERPVAGFGGVPHRVSELAVPLVPPGRAPMQGGPAVRVLAGSRLARVGCSGAAMEVPNWAAGLSICRRRRRRLRRRIYQAGAGPKNQVSPRGITWLSRTRPLIAASATATEPWARGLPLRPAPLVRSGSRPAGGLPAAGWPGRARSQHRPPRTGAPFQCGPSFRLTSLEHRSCSAVASWPAAAGSPRASGQFRRFPVNVEEFEPEVLDSPQEAVQGRLVGSGTPQHRRIAYHAYLRVFEDTPHPGTRDTADGDHIGAIGHISRLCHSFREPPGGVSCLHPFRVRRPVVAWVGMTLARSWDNTPDGTFVPVVSEPDVIGSL
jgi:hypothetical protein